MCDNYVRGVIISQRILECLGMNRLVTLGQLCQYIEEQRPVFEGDEKIDYFPFSAFFDFNIDVQKKESRAHSKSSLCQETTMGLIIHTDQRLDMTYY